MIAASALLLAACGQPTNLDEPDRRLQTAGSSSVSDAQKAAAQALSIGTITRLNADEAPLRYALMCNMALETTKSLFADTGLLDTRELAQFDSAIAHTGERLSRLADSGGTTEEELAEERAQVRVLLPEDRDLVLAALGCLRDLAAEENG